MWWNEGGCNYSHSWVLDQLELGEEFVGKVEERKVAKVNAAGNEAVQQDEGAIGGMGGAKIDNAQMETTVEFSLQKE